MSLNINIKNFYTIKNLLIEYDFKNKTHFSKRIQNFELNSVDNISNRFHSYIEFLKTTGIKIKIDNNLKIKLKKIESEYNKNKTEKNDKFLLRILGILSDTTFIGPEYFHMDISNPCNIDCNYCWFYSKYLKNPYSNEFKKAMIDYNDFTKIVDDLECLRTDTILFTGAGEPFLHPKINDMIKYTNNKFKIQIFTNGTKINKESSKLITNHSDIELYISVSASNPKTYKKVHPKQKKELFYECENNIKQLIDSREKNKNVKSIIVLLFVLCKDNYKDIEEMANWSNKLGVNSVRYQIAHNNDAKVIELNNNEKDIVRNKINKVIKKYENEKLHINPNIIFQLENTKKSNEWYNKHYQNKGCYVGWFFSRLWAEKTYSFCCIRKEVEHHNHKNSFDILWNSKKYKNYRNAAKSFGKINIELKKGYNLIDKDCSHCGNYEINEKVHRFLLDSKLIPQ
jgi:wyosine [tRNA(Phe)-imidazoG37] synthetase (radical SAM superfamily)